MASGSSGEKTEKATGKRRDEARKEGQVLKSAEVNSAFAIASGFAMLALWGPHIWTTMGREMRLDLQETSLHTMTTGSCMDLFGHVCSILAVTAGPILGVMLVSGVIANVLQVKFRFTPGAIKPKFSKINPISGLKQKLSLSSVFELFKSIVKIIVVGGPASLIVYAKRNALLMLGGADPMVAGKLAASLIIEIGMTVAAIYILVAVADYVFQHHKFEKSLKMTKQEVKQEQRQQDVAPEMKQAQRRRQRAAARKRMLADVPTADVIITNPTHYSVALKYDPEYGAPQVVAKGVDLLALRIREIAADNDVPKVENVQLARTLYAQVEVGQTIPADLFTAVAEVLAFVFQLQEKRRRQGYATPDNVRNLAA